MKAIFLLLFFILAFINLYAADTGCLSNQASATSLTLNSPTGSVNLNAGDKHYYKLTLPVSGKISLTTISSIDTRGYLYDSSCNPITDNDDTGTNLNFLISEYLEAGDYYLLVKGYNNSTTGNYILTNMYGILITTSERNFKIRNPVETRNIVGDYQIVGNTVLCVKNNGECYDYTGASANNNLDLQYIDTDSVTNTFNNSSQAKISIPPDSKVIWAAIYAQGHLPNKTKEASVNLLIDPMTIKVPGLASTINSIPQQIDLLSRSGSSGYTYSTYSEIPELKGKSASAVNGFVTVANVKAYTGTESSGLGNYGAWSLVIVYEDTSASLKNISVFDGYRSISNGKNETITIDGFLTPNNGDIVSQVSIFAGEGDKNIAGDKLFFNNEQIGNTSNAFYSNISSDIERNPSYSNNQGIDIQTFDIGKSGLGLLGNSQTSANIKFTSTQDAYYPSVAIFSTNLYEPRVCYKQEFLDINGNPLDEVIIGDTITVRTWISNMKKDDNDTNLETADKVEITLELDSNNLEYNENTFKMRNLDESSYTNMTDDLADDRIDWLADSNTTKWRVGTGADDNDGGQLLPNGDGVDNKKAYIEFQTTLLTEGNVTVDNVYKVSYENSLLGIRFGDESPLNIGICTDVNSSIHVGGLPGDFNVIDENTDISNIYLGTKVVSRPSTVNVISLDDSGEALKNYTGEVTVHLIQGDFASACANDDDSCKENACNGAGSLQNLGVVSFNNENTSPLTFTYETAIKNASFQISYADENKKACATDSFAIRPRRFNLNSAPAPNLLISRAENKTITYVAEDEDGTASTGYNEVFANLVVTSLLANPNGLCPNPNLNLQLPAVAFIDGVAAGNSMLGRVGVFNIVLSEVVGSEFASIDAIDTLQADRLIEESNVNITIVPDHFTTTAPGNINNEANFTYISNDLTQMAIRLNVNVTAQNSNNIVTPNYTTGCFANPTDLTIGYNINLGNMPLNIRYREFIVGNDINLATVGGQLTFLQATNNPLPATLFTNANNGTAPLQIRVNFPRTRNNPINPFRVNFNNFFVSDNTFAPNFIVSNQATRVINENATMLYGRTNIPRSRFQANANQVAFIYYEAYCDAACNQALLPNAPASNYTNDPRWFVNPQHTALSGTAGAVNQKGFIPNNGLVTQDANPPHLNQVAVSYDGTRNLPYKATMQNTPPNWLLYNRFNLNPLANEFEVEFEGSSNGWVGQSPHNTTTGQGGTTTTNRRSMW